MDNADFRDAVLTNYMTNGTQCNDHLLNLMFELMMLFPYTCNQFLFSAKFLHTFFAQNRAQSRFPRQIDLFSVLILSETNIFEHSFDLSDCVVT